RDAHYTNDDIAGGEANITGEIPHLITIPTTSGTGSEVGRSAVISDDTTHQKRILFSPRLIARMVFADPALTLDLPASATAATGMDALTHNLEAFLARMHHPVCEGIALEGISLISEALERAVNRPDLESRSLMMMGSIMGGIAFQKGLVVVLSLAQPLSTLLDVHHGLANAVNLPHEMEFNTEGLEPKFRRIAHALHLGEESGDA